METSGFDYQLGAFQGCPQWEYFWYRKRQCILRLLQRNRPQLCNGQVRAADIGCGDGRDLFLIRSAIFSDLQNRRFVAIEAGATALTITRSRVDYFAADDVTVIKANLTESLPLANGALDLVICSEVVEHLEHPQRLLSEIRRTLKPSGHLLLTTPNEPNILQRSFWSSTRRKHIASQAFDRDDSKAIKYHGHISVKPIREWLSILQACGFREVDAERGALVYAFGPKHEIAWAIQFVLEGVLDVLPLWLSRYISDEMISLLKAV